jgi:hypothetical protein
LRALEKGLRESRRLGGGILRGLHAPIIAYACLWDN